MKDERENDKEREKLDDVTSWRTGKDEDTMKGRDIQTHARGAEGSEDLLNSGSTMAGEAGRADEDLTDPSDPRSE